MKEARFWDAGDYEQVICKLCAHKCKINKGKKGICGVRENNNGKLYTLVYGRAGSLAVDPIEKKPLYHFYPGTQVLSFGTVGCNFSCLFCQNVSLSQGQSDSIYLKNVSVNEVVDAALKYDGLAWTYNEPTMSYEFSYDVFKNLKKRKGGYTVYVTNGYMQEAPLQEISPYLDAMNIDVKAFRSEFYRAVVGGKLEPVLKTCKIAFDLGIHVELTYLVVPGHNDGSEEIRDFSEWVRRELSDDTVVHFSRFHPHHKMSHLSPTPEHKMSRAKDIARDAGLNFVYLGNLPSNNNLYCPKCHHTLLKRGYFSSGELKLDDGRCPNCGREIPIIY